MKKQPLEDSLNTLGERLRSRRHHMGWTRREMADATGVKETTIETVEVGRTRPNTDQVMAWCRVMGMSPNWLLTGSNEWIPADDSAETDLGAAVKMVTALNILPAVRRKVLREVIFDLARVNVPASELATLERLLALDLSALDGAMENGGTQAAERLLEDELRGVLPPEKQD